MADVGEYDGIIARADAFRQLISGTIRDLRHAALAIIDRNDYHSCVRTLAMSRKALCEALGDANPEASPNETSISNQSLRMTLQQILWTAEGILREFEKLDEDGTPDDISSWLATRGKELLTGLARFVGHLLSAGNLREILQKQNPVN